MRSNAASGTAFGQAGPRRPESVPGSTGCPWPAITWEVELLRRVRVSLMHRLADPQLVVRPWKGSTMYNLADVRRSFSVMAVITVAAACGGRDDAYDADSVLARDLTMAGVDSSLPEIRDTSLSRLHPPCDTEPRPPSSVRRPPPPPRAPAVSAPVPIGSRTSPVPCPHLRRARRVIRGDEMSIRPAARVHTNSPGQISATLTEQGDGENGEIIPREPPLSGGLGHAGTDATSP